MMEREGGPARELDELFVRIQPALEKHVRRQLWRLGLHGVSVDDVLHTTYMNLRRGPAWLNEAGRDEERTAYFRKAAYNAVVDETPRRAPRPVEPLDEDALADLPASLASTGPVTKADQRRALCELGRHLPDARDRELFRLILEEGLDTEQLADRLGISKRLVKRRYDRVRRRLELLLRQRRHARTEGRDGPR